MRPLSSNLCFALTISHFAPRPASSAVLIVPIMFCLRIQKARTCFFPSSFKGREGVGEVDRRLCLVLSTINLLSTHKAVPRYGNLVDGNLAKSLVCQGSKRLGLELVTWFWELDKETAHATITVHHHNLLRMGLSARML